MFASRVQKNLDFIAVAGTHGQDVHPVTQVVTALLGVVVFPWEHSALGAIKREKLPGLEADHGWPKWTMQGPRRVFDVGQLIHVLRNCVAHGSIQFSSDSRNPADVDIVFSQEGWTGTIRADRLIEFCRCFTSAMKNRVD